MDCWDYKACGNKERCPAYPSNGRKCALVLGTLCHGERQDGFSDKVNHCISCGFFRSGYHAETIDQG